MDADPDGYAFPNDADKEKIWETGRNHTPGLLLYLYLSGIDLIFLRVFIALIKDLNIMLQDFFRNPLPGFCSC